MVHLALAGKELTLDKNQEKLFCFLLESSLLDSVTHQSYDESYSTAVDYKPISIVDFIHHD